ncbi:hypothetical protein H6783_03380 [Candidatus Nomurabacteria bacterium]|nr:hypothetical protein [Candidatus Nomurabacteria bacterium]
MEIIILILSENAILFLTALSVGILFYYTKETYLLRKETQKQSQVGFTPYLSLRNLESGATFSNLGKGIALHVQTKDGIEVDSGKILSIPSIGPGEDRNLYHTSKDGKSAFTLYARELPDTIVVTYSDVLGNKYEASFSRVYPSFGVFKESSQSMLN